MPEALPPASTTRRGVDSSKFMGASFAAGKGLEKRVASNEKKITILKNILKMRQQSENIGNTLTGIQDSVDSIAETVALQYQEDLDQTEKNRINDEQDEGRKREGALEKVSSGVVKTAQKALAPVKSFMEKIGNFLQMVLLGGAVVKLLEWFGDSKNKDKIQSIKRFVSDWWPVIIGGIIAFVSPFLLKAGIILGVIALLAWGVPKIIDAVKSLMDWGKNLVGNIFGKQEEELANTLKTESDGIGKVFDAANAQIEANNKEGGEETQTTGEETQTTGEQTTETTGEQTTETGETQVSSNQTTDTSSDLKENTQEFAEGGIVRGPGGIDNVPARLTAGEFVMSKGAVDKWGPDMLAGMNSRGGGTNEPVNLAFNGGGLVDLRPTEVNNVIPTESLVPYDGKEYRKKFQFGGSVSGPGGRDNVPAKLTAGEFVMSKNAVSRYGAHTFAKMNASGGGTNNPVGNKYFVGGLVKRAKEFFTPGPPVKKKNKVEVIPVSSPSSSTPSRPTATGNKIPKFSSKIGGGTAKEQVLGIRR
tara:strand:- start:131 stop:1726 length:1596 start_codon:yes stop_codon:yes gene_type:complete